MRGTDLNEALKLANREIPDYSPLRSTAPAPSSAFVQHNIKLSTQALERVAKRLAKPGVTLRTKKDVPLYSLDSDNPDVMIRKLNGKTERGQLVDGSFKAID